MNPWHWWRLNLGFNGYEFEYTGVYNGTNFASTDYALKTNVISKVNLPYKINWQTTLNYTAGRRTAQTRYWPRYNFDVALSKDFPEHNLSFSLTGRDLFNTNRRRFLTEAVNFTTEGDLLFRGRQFSLNIVYKINPEKAKRGGKRRRFGSFEGGGY